MPTETPKPPLQIIDDYHGANDAVQTESPLKSFDKKDAFIEDQKPIPIENKPPENNLIAKLDVSLLEGKKLINGVLSLTSYKVHCLIRYALLHN
jgi:hypothetical protein